MEMTFAPANRSTFEQRKRLVTGVAGAIERAWRRHARAALIVAQSVRHDDRALDRLF